MVEWFKAPVLKTVRSSGLPVCVKLPAPDPPSSFTSSDHYLRLAGNATTWIRIAAGEDEMDPTPRAENASSQSASLVCTAAWLPTLTLRGLLQSPVCRLTPLTSQSQWARR